MRTHGHPVLGGFAGFFFGVFFSLLLLTAGAVKLDSVLLAVFPILFLILGIVLAFWAPFGGGAASAGPAPTGRGGFSGGTVAGPPSGPPSA